MRWRGRRQSRNVEDRRGQRMSPMGLGGGRGMSLLPLLFKLAGTKGGLVIIAIGLGVLWLTGGNLGGLLGGLGGPGAPAGLSPGGNQPVQQTAAERETVAFISVVLADTEEVWHELFKQVGQPYKEPKLVLFRGATRSACGVGQAAMGPFYCPADQQVYIDLSFYRELSDRFKAPGDFAQAYVLAHEVGHHVQTLLGISARSQELRQRVSEVEANQISVRQELQADCFAGVWAHHAHKARNILEQGDIEEALGAATAIGDDRLQKQSRGYITPDSFTHGTSAQRVKWFRIGIQQGSLSACDTFKTRDL